MFLRLLWESFVRQRRRKLLAGIAILLGTTAVTAMLALATTIGDRIHKELAVYGANIIVYPKAEQLAVKVGGVDIKPTSNAYLKESDLPKLKTIFWGNNITGISPELSLKVVATKGISGLPIAANATGYLFDHLFDGQTGSIETVAPAFHPWWKLEGNWPSVYKRESANAPYLVAVGATLAKRLDVRVGDFLNFDPNSTDSRQTSEVIPGLRPAMTVVGVVTTGDAGDDQIFLTLDAAQFLLFGWQSNADFISRVEISARTKPEDAFARHDPDTLSPKDHDRWYCSPYANSIAYQIREAIPGAAAEQVRQVEQSEGNILSRISGLMWLISAAALLAAGFAVSAAMATAILERRGEIGLMRSLGASKAAIALLFYAETSLLAILGGTLGYLIGSTLAAWLGARIFTDPSAQTTLHAATIFNPVLLPVIVATALIVAIAGSTPSIRTALKMDPSTVLREDA
jgi:putative ABC transport system permease protein